MDSIVPVVSRAVCVLAAMSIVIVAVSACDEQGGPSRGGPAVVTLDEIHVGTTDSSGTAYAAVKCLGDRRPYAVVHADRLPDADDGGWRPYGDPDEPEVRMRLELANTDARRARINIELRIDQAIYRSGRAAEFEVDPGWKGSAIFRDVPLASGEAYDGRSSFDEVAVDWDCRSRS